MPRYASRHGTSPFIWCAAIICAIISVVVICGGIVVFVGYMVIHPRVPIISVADAHLDFLKYCFPVTLPLMLIMNLCIINVMINIFFLGLIDQV